MKTLNKFKTIAFMMLALGVLLSATLTSCGGKKEEATTEHAEGGEHPEGEHPAADTTAKDSTASM